VRQQRAVSLYRQLSGKDPRAAEAEIRRQTMSLAEPGVRRCVRFSMITSGMRALSRSRRRIAVQSASKAVGDDGEDEDGLVAQ
jgi:hypothetical protein